eukprot:GFUD01077290.1.p1 GENE.GFUD01077290.1~~GFUD01077290.1.p1  ORF type:complete len:278 (-),score=70.22 GFUD01077290.1:20-853(-)
MAFLSRMSRCLESASSIPTDVKFIFRGEEGAIMKEVAAHKIILGIASDVFERQFFGCLGEPKDEIEIKDAKVEVFDVMVQYIYHKKLDWMEYDLSFLSSLYYLAEKFIIEELREEIIASIPKHEVSEENVLDMAILAEDNLHHQPLSDALYEAAASFLQHKFDGKLENVYNFCSEIESSQANGLVLLKMLAKMKVLQSPKCENCKQTPCLNGQLLTRENFVPGATVVEYHERSKLVQFDIDFFDGSGVQRELFGRKMFGQTYETIGYYSSNPTFKCF